MPSAKLCRYGSHCSRPGCRFRHENQTSSPTNSATISTTPTITPVTSNNPYYNNTWLPHEIVMKLDNENHLKIEQSTSENNDEGQPNQKENLKYSLTAVVCHISDQQAPERRNVVSLIRVPSSYDKDSSSNSKWYIFNDISISWVPAQEAVWFSLDWKVPCVLYYSTDEVFNARSEIAPSITQDVFLEDKCLARSGGTRGITFTPLATTEMPKPGELVAMDAEFVTLNQEEAELRSDGKMSTIKPSHMSVARITCIRG